MSRETRWMKTRRSDKTRREEINSGQMIKPLRRVKECERIRNTKGQEKGRKLEVEKK